MRFSIINFALIEAQRQCGVQPRELGSTRINSPKNLLLCLYSLSLSLSFLPPSFVAHSHVCVLINIQTHTCMYILSSCTSVCTLMI